MVDETPLINDFGKTIETRFGEPSDFIRTKVEANSFGDFLRNLELKPEGAQAKYFNGNLKPNHNIYVSVVDLPISPKDIQINSDAILRLRAEYLFVHKQYDKIVFNIKNEKYSFVDFCHGDYSLSNFYDYLDMVMEKISNADFCKELEPINLNDLQVGDVFIQKNLPNGHAVIVVDVVQDEFGQKLFLLAQSFTPAQEIQVISNPSRDDISPWYELKPGQLLTPEWRFMTSDLMRFKNL